MRCFASLIFLPLIASCTATTVGPEPSLAPRAAEAIDPRLPIPNDATESRVDPALAGRLAQFVGEAQGGVAPFDAKLAEADRLAAAAGPMASESWVVAQQALSLLVEQYGVTTQAAANIDQLGSNRLQGQHWISPADQQAIAAAAAEVGAIGDRQSAAIDRLNQRLAR
jgi:hypothetical protein